MVLLPTARVLAQAEQAPFYSNGVVIKVIRMEPSSLIESSTLQGQSKKIPPTSKIYYKISYQWQRIKFGSILKSKELSVILESTEPSSILEALFTT